jgi:hypothetical protein
MSAASLPAGSSIPFDNGAGQRPVSRRSVWSDPVWELDIDVAGRRADQKRLRWGIALPDGARLTDPRHAHLLEAARRFVWSMSVDPPDGRRRSCSSSLFTRAGQLLTLIRWMVGEGITTFRSLDRSAVDRYQAFVQQRRGPRPGRTCSTTVAGYLRVRKDLYHQRDKLPDALGFDPFPHTTAGIIAGVSRATRGTIPFIPDSVAVDLMSKALHWIEHETDGMPRPRAKLKTLQKVVGITNMHINDRIREFAAFNRVRRHAGRPWRFSTHQFRKTFARFIARRDRSQLLALADHLKHVSVAMTAKGYVGTDFDLHQLVDHEGQIETARALDRFLSADWLAGKMGERIAAGNASFRGRAGEQLRRDYIGCVLKETDLSIHACEYGWCVFQAETSRCGGKLAPDPVGRSPAVCLDCTNFVVEPKHASYWRERRERNASIIPKASRLTRAALDEAIAQCDRVLSRLEGNHVEDFCGGPPQPHGSRLPSRTRPPDRGQSDPSRSRRTPRSHHPRRSR